MPNTVVQTSPDAAYYANVNPTPDGYTRVQLCRRVLWQGPKYGVGCNRPKPMQRHVCTVVNKVEPFHVVLDRTFDLLLQLENEK